MSFTRRFDQFNEECVVGFDSDGDERIFLPLCGITRCRPDYRIGRINSPECVIEYVVSGRGTFTVDGLTFHPTAGDVYLAPQGSTHQYHTDPDDRWVKIWFNFRGTLVPELLHLYHLEHLRHLPESGLGGLFAELLDTMRHELDNAREAASVAAMRLIHHLNVAVQGKSTVDSTAMTARKWLENHAAERIGLAGLADFIGCSESQLNRLFRAEFGLSPYAFHLERRLELAARLLADTTRPIKAIADELGFGDVYYFSNLFKRKRGCSPLAWRRDPGRRIRKTTSSTTESSAAKTVSS